MLKMLRHLTVLRWARGQLATAKAVVSKIITGPLSFQCQPQAVTVAVPQQCCMPYNRLLTPAFGKAFAGSSGRIVDLQRTLQRLGQLVTKEAQCAYNGHIRPSISPG